MTLTLDITDATTLAGGRQPQVQVSGLTCRNDEMALATHLVNVTTKEVKSFIDSQSKEGK